MKIEDILVPIDFSPGSLRALDYALAMVDSGGEVYLLHVVEPTFWRARVMKVSATRKRGGRNCSVKPKSSCDRSRKNSRY